MCWSTTSFRKHCRTCCSDTEPPRFVLAPDHSCHTTLTSENHRIVTLHTFEQNCRGRHHLRYPVMPRQRKASRLQQVKLVLLHIQADDSIRRKIVLPDETRKIGEIVHSSLKCVVDMWCWVSDWHSRIHLTEKRRQEIPGGGQKKCPGCCVGVKADFRVACCTSR